VRRYADTSRDALATHAEVLADVVTFLQKQLHKAEAG